MKSNKCSSDINRRTIISGLALLPTVSQTLLPSLALAQQNPVTAIDIALEPDAKMIQHAMAANARLRKSFPKGFALDETHHPHVTMCSSSSARTTRQDICGGERGSDQRETNGVDAEGVQVLLHPVSAAWPRGNRSRTDRRPASAAR
jgi:hypothetical protein